MDQETQRRAENFAIVVPLKDVDDADVLAFIGSLIQDSDHLREKLETEPDYDKKREKLEAMRPHLRFRALPLSVYVAASAAKQCGVQPIYEDQERASSMVKTPSRVHEVRN